MKGGDRWWGGAIAGEGRRSQREGSGLRWSVGGERKQRFDKAAMVFFIAKTCSDHLCCCT